MAANTSSEYATTNYESFFGFREAPFSLAPNTRFRFDSASHHAVLDQVTYALQRREPVVVVTGEIGTGKTLLCRTVIERLDRKTFLSIINDPRVGRDDLLKQMLQDFGIISADRTKVVATSRADLIHALNEFLQSLARLDAHAIVVIDEAQHLEPDVLEEIRLLSNIQDERGTMLQIILVGQTDLKTLLAKPELQQLRQRISRYAHLESMAAEEVSKYVAHRLAVAREGSGTPGARELERAIAEWQGSTLKVAFSADAIDRVARLSRGVPRVVNLLCDRALEAAYASESYVVDDQLIEGAARALNLAEAPPATTEPPVAEPSLEPHDSFWATPADVPTEVALEKPASPAAQVGRYLGFAAVLALVFAIVWFGMRTFTSRPAAEPPTAPSTARPDATTPSPTAAQPQAPPPAPPAPPQSSATAPSSQAPPGAAPSADAYEIVVASFRTEARSAAVAAEIGALTLPVRQRTANGWQQVLAGPFRSRAQADEAQQRLERAGFTNTQIVPVSR